MSLTLYKTKQKDTKVFLHQIYEQSIKRNKNSFKQF